MHQQLKLARGLPCKKSIRSRLTQLSAGPYVVPIWSRNPLDLWENKTLELHCVVTYVTRGSTFGVRHSTTPAARTYPWSAMQ